MRVTTTSEGGILIKIELSQDERTGIKEDLLEHFDGIKKITDNYDTDNLLKEIVEVL